MAGQFELYEDRAGEYRFCRKAGNGKGIPVIPELMRQSCPGI